MHPLAAPHSQTLAAPHLPEHQPQRSGPSVWSARQGQPQAHHCRRAADPTPRSACLRRAPSALSQHLVPCGGHATCCSPIFIFGQPSLRPCARRFPEMRREATYTWPLGPDLPTQAAHDGSQQTGVSAAGLHEAFALCFSDRSFPGAGLWCWHYLAGGTGACVRPGRGTLSSRTRARPAPGLPGGGAGVSVLVACGPAA